MKRAVLFAIAVCAMVAVSGSVSWATSCGGPLSVGHQLDSFFLCDDSAPLQAFIYEIGAPAADNSGVLRVGCRFPGSNDPGIGSSCIGVGSGGPNDGQITIETDAFIAQWNGCPAPPGQLPKRIAAIVVDAKGHGLILSVSGHDPSLAYQFEAAQPFDPATGAISPVACGTISSRPQIRNMSVSGSTATLSLHQDKPPVYTDCDPGTLGRFLFDTSGGLSCDDNFQSAVTLGRIYTRTDACPNATTGPANSAFVLNSACTGAGAPNSCCTGAGTGTCWAPTTVTPDAAGNATVVVQLPAVATPPQCLFVGGTGSFGGGPEGLTGYTPVPPQGAASPRAESVAASKNGGKVRVTWTTSNEINLAAFKILTHKKGTLTELSTVSPTGAGGPSRYSVDIAMSAFQGSKDVVVRALLNDGTFVDAAPVNF